jgi:hypothetical protein
VPQSHTDDLKPYLSKLKLDNGYMVPTDAPASSSVYETAENADPDISYITMHVSVSPLVQMGEPTSSSDSGGSGGGSSKKKSSGKPD